jgi:hypothetical protein
VISHPAALSILVILGPINAYPSTVPSISQSPALR